MIQGVQAKSIAALPLRPGAERGSRTSPPTTTLVKLARLEPGAGIPMIMAQQDVGLASQHDFLAGLQRVGDQVYRAEGTEQGMVSDPAWEKDERKRVCGRNGQG